MCLQGCPAFSHLTLTGGAIGSGPPMAVGAAIACANRVVINIQANTCGAFVYVNNPLYTSEQTSVYISNDTAHCCSTVLTAPQGKLSLYAIHSCTCQQQPAKCLKSNTHSCSCQSPELGLARVKQRPAKYPKSYTH